MGSASGATRHSGWDSEGGLNCLTHVLPRCLFRRRLKRRMGEGGRSAVTGRRGPLGRRLERVTALVPLLLTGVRLHPPEGGPTRTSADVSVPRLAGFSLIT